MGQPLPADAGRPNFRLLLWVPLLLTTAWGPRVPGWPRDLPETHTMTHSTADQQTSSSLNLKYD